VKFEVIRSLEKPVTFFFIYFVDRASRYISLLMANLTHFFISLFITPLYIFYVCVSVHHNSILYKEPTRCSFGSIVY
jgi:hypothetical protein